MKRLISHLLPSVLMLSAAGCSDLHDGSSHFETLPDQGWSYGDSVAFVIDGLDSIQKPRNVSVALRHDNDYPFRNLWLEVTYCNPLPAARDTVSIELADEYGRWHGKGLGPSYQMEASIPHPVNLSCSSRVYIRHIMRVDTLHGISQIGLSVTSTGN